MDWTTLIGPAVVAATISGLVGFITVWVSARNARAIHTEKLTFDAEQAERRAGAEIALAEKRVALDRALATWKRRTELAEETLADFYKARDIIHDARSPFLIEGEGSTRQREPLETEEDTRTLNAYFATAERLIDNAELFSQLQARRYRFLALFGGEAAEAYDQIFRVRREVIGAVRKLIATHSHRDRTPMAQNRGGWEAVAGWGYEGDDPVAARVNQAIAAIEHICRPVIQDAAP